MMHAASMRRCALATTTATATATKKARGVVVKPSISTRLPSSFRQLHDHHQRLSARHEGEQHEQDHHHRHRCHRRPLLVGNSRDPGLWGANHVGRSIEARSRQYQQHHQQDSYRQTSDDAIAAASPIAAAATATAAARVITITRDASAAFTSRCLLIPSSHPSKQQQLQPRGRAATVAAAPLASAISSTSSPSLSLLLSPAHRRAQLPKTRSLGIRHSSDSSKDKMSPHSTTLLDALASNAAWADATSEQSPSFFAESAKGQHPKILWLGCSDSRVPESTVLNLPPGQVFTHRNIANVLTNSDLSSLSVIEYAVAHVGVQHVVVCGHTKCGGVAAALQNSRIGVIDAWLQPLRATRQRLVHEGKLGPDISPADQSLRLVEENVREGVRTLRSNPNVIRAARDRGVTVHGLVYDLATGKLHELDVEEDHKAAHARIEAHTCD